MSMTTVEAVPKQPDIQYAPDFEKYQARTKLRLQSQDLPTTVPDGFPSQLTGDLVWEGETLKEKYNWTYELNSAEVQEIEEGLAHFKDQSAFPLPTLHATLRRLSRELHQGHGFFVLRNLPIATHDRADNIAIYAGVASHIAPLRGRQDTHHNGQPADMVLNHVKDLSATSQQSSVGSPAYTSDAQVFHTDSGDIVSLLCLSEAAAGGTSRLASTWRVYNELAATRPDLVHTLAAPWPFENFGKGGAATAQEKCSMRPLMYYQPATSSSNGDNTNPAQQQQPDRILLQYARRYFTGFGALLRSGDVPPLSEAQAEALDALHFLGKRFNVGLEFRAGDAQFVNNLACFHARDAFRDDEGQRRHLVRLWLRDPEYAWDTPQELREKWEGLYAGVRPEHEVFPLEPTVRAESKGGS